MASAFGLTLLLRLLSHFSSNQAENDPFFVYVCYAIIFVSLAVGLYLLLRPRRARRKTGPLGRMMAALFRLPRKADGGGAA